MSDDRPNAYRENGNSIYRASAFGSCLKAIVAAMLGYQEDRPKFQADTLSNAAKEGNLHEDAIVEELKRDYGWRVWGDQDVVEVKVIPLVYLRGHIDGRCIPKRARNERGLEIKTMSDARFKKWKAAGSTVRERLLTDEFERYGMQVSIYMYALGQPFMYVVKNRNSGELMIEELKLAPFDWKQIKQKAIQAEMWRVKGELPRCNASSGEKFFCPFPYLHDEDMFGDEPDDEEAPIDNATAALLAGMAEHYVEIQKKVAALKPLEDERKDLGKKILEAMGGNDGVKNLIVGKYALDRIDNTRKYVNHAAAAKALGVTEAQLKAALEESRQPKTYPYVKVKELSK